MVYYFFFLLIFVDYIFISFFIINFCFIDFGGEFLGIYCFFYYFLVLEIEGFRIRIILGYDYLYDVVSFKIQIEWVFIGEQFDLIGLIVCVCVEKYNFYFNIIFYKKDLVFLNSIYDSSFVLLLVFDFN